MSKQTDSHEVQPSDLLEQPEEHLDGQSERFLAALEDLRMGRTDRAGETLRGILSVEPRLAEPRMELARILLDTGRLRDAEAEAREALGILEAGGQWTEELPEDVVLGLAHGLLAETLRQIADTDEVIFGDPAKFHAITLESRRLFERAAQLDADNQHASYHAFFLGIPGLPLADRVVPAGEE